MKTDQELEAIRNRWHTEVFERPEEIDPDDEYTWDGVLMGFLLGAGVPLEQADEIVAKAGRNGWEI